MSSCQRVTSVWFRRCYAASRIIGIQNTSALVPKCPEPSSVQTKGLKCLSAKRSGSEVSTPRTSAEVSKRHFGTRSEVSQG